jgi:hypothetical protein
MHAAALTDKETAALTLGGGQVGKLECVAATDCRAAATERHGTPGDVGE